jgi:broad specificity phosphatase PhoE
MTKKIIFLALIILSFQSCKTVKNKEVFTIYLVRHAEKGLSTDEFGDPDLTSCGRQRSEQLRNFLSDVKLDAVYSTDYIRTKKTAQPTASSKGLKIQEYKDNDLIAFSKTLIDAKQDVLVVGHSNTTGVLAGLLTGKEMGAFDLDIYDRIYQVIIYKKKRRLQIFHSAFECKDSIF